MPPLHHELLGGTVGGVLLAFFGHPLDTIKVKMQNLPETHGRRGGLIRCVRATVMEDGVRGLFAGLSPPLFLNGALNAVLFATFGTAKQVVARLTGGEAKKLSLPQVCAASLLSAPFYCAFVTPVDAIKVNLQTGVARSPIKCVQSLGLRGLYASYFPTLGTRLVGSPCYFGAYESVKVTMTRRNVVNTLVVGLVSGFIAGVSFWTAMFPIDLVKSRVSISGAMLVNGAAARAESTGTLSVVRDIWAREGIRGFYRGFFPCVLRAGPANAVMFIGYEWTMQFLCDKSDL